MGRPPCCDKVGVKKGPWTPEEDIMLVSYVQEHGPGNWRAVPATTGHNPFSFSFCLCKLPTYLPCFLLLNFAQIHRFFVVGYWI